MRAANRAVVVRYTTLWCDEALDFVLPDIVDVDMVIYLLFVICNNCVAHLLGISHQKV